MDKYFDDDLMVMSFVGQSIFDMDMSISANMALARGNKMLFVFCIITAPLISKYFQLLFAVYKLLAINKH